MEPQYEVAMKHRSVYTDPVPTVSELKPDEENTVQIEPLPTDAAHDEATETKPFYFMPVDPSTESDTHRPHKGASHKQYMGRGGHALIAKQLARKEWQNIFKAGSKWMEDQMESLKDFDTWKEWKK